MEKTFLYPLNNFTSYEKVVCIIQARVNSKRFPGKILMPLLNKSVLQYQLERPKKLKRVDTLILATTKNKNDNKLVKIAKEKKFLFMEEIKTMF